jgi:hypothetical protein
MNANRPLIWVGEEPLPGVRERLEQRGYKIFANLSLDRLEDKLLRLCSIAVFNGGQTVSDYKAVITSMINHGIKLVFVLPDLDRPKILTDLEQISATYPWINKCTFITKFSGINMDNFVIPAIAQLNNFQILYETNEAKLNREEEILVRRAFTKATELKVNTLAPGYSGNKVLLVYEKRQQNSIAHWTQPRLVKIGNRNSMIEEVGHMKAVAPFVPFDLRPSLDVHIEGLDRALFVADFVENSESLLSAARSGRAEGALSNLFNRTLYRWRERAGNHYLKDSLAQVAERLGFVEPGKIRPEYLTAERFEKTKYNVEELWDRIKKVKSEYLAASIHGDLHGENVRVRRDDAILIDFGSVLGAKNGDAPLCFDVAMLEVTLVFSPDPKFDQSEFENKIWEEKTRKYYSLEAIRHAIVRDRPPGPPSDLFECIVRIRSFGNYQHIDGQEYAIALAIALWRWSKFKPANIHDTGRRVVALEIGCSIIEDILKEQT